MTAVVLPFVERRGEPCAGPTCIRVVRPRHPGNIPAYCSYECGVAGQPEHVQVTLRRSYEDSQS